LHRPIGIIGKFFNDWNYALIYDFGGSSDGFGGAAPGSLAGLAVWLLFAFFWQMLVPIVTMAVAPPDPYDPISALRTIDVGMDISRFSPNTLFSEATLAFLSPTTRSLGPVLSSQVQGSIRGAPLPLSDSLALVWPQLTALLATVILLFAIAYILFQRQEVRA
jgi:ABC-2 type transport system permease protein